MISFKGRLNRKAFLIQSIIVGLIQFLNVIVISFVQKSLAASTDTSLSLLSLPISLVSIAISICVAIFSISISIKRWHDLGKSGWWTLTNLIPLINIFVWIYLIFKKGNTGSNQFGSPQN